MCLFIVTKKKKKRNIKSRKIDKRERKMLVLKHSITPQLRIIRDKKYERGLYIEQSQERLLSSNIMTYNLRIRTES